MGLLAPVVLMVSRRLLGLEASFNSFLIGTEISNVLPAQSDIVASFRGQSYAGNRAPTARMPFGVSSVFSSGHATQVLDAVVQTVSVNVVDICGPLSSHNSPDHSVGEKILPEYCAQKIAVVVDDGKSLFPSKSAVPRLRVRCCSILATVLEPMHATLAPRQNAAGSIIFKKLFKNFAGKVGFSHWGLSERSLWSGLVGWWNTPQARIYTPSCRANAMREV